MGPDGHVLTFPVDHGQTLNIVAFRTTADDWPDFHKLTRPAKREDALRDFEGYGSNVRKLLQLTKPDLDVVSGTYTERRCLDG
jgi:salicylate hydroxylase